MSRWSDSASAGRPAFPADGVGWRTETAEWRATDQSARWRQTTEWRSTSGTHGYRTTTEAWQTGAGAEGFTPPVESSSRQPLAISGTAYPTPQGDGQAADGNETARTWQADDGAGNTSWHRITGDPPPPPAAAEPRPAWQQFTEPTSSAAPWQSSSPAAPWQQSAPGAPWQQSAPSWQSTDRPSATPSPSWQSLVDQPDQGRPSWNTTGPVPTINGTAVPGADYGARSAPLDEGRHLVREDDRDRWRREFGTDESRSGGRRRAADPGSRTGSGTGWSTRSDADNWAGHADTGSMQMFDAAALATPGDAPTWRGSDEPATGWRDDPARPSWRDDPDAARNSTAPPSWRTDAGAPRHVSAAPAWNTEPDPSRPDQDPRFGQDPRGVGQDPRGLDPRGLSQDPRGLGLDPRTRGQDPRGLGQAGPAPWSAAPSSPDPRGPAPRSPEPRSGPTSYAPDPRSGTPSWGSESTGRRRATEDEGPSWRRDPADSPRVNGAAATGWQRDDDRRGAQPPPVNGAAAGPAAIGWRPEEPPTENWRDPQRANPADTGSWRDPQRANPADTGSWRDPQRANPADTGSWRDAQRANPADTGSWRDPQRANPADTGSWRDSGGRTGPASPAGPGPGDPASRRRVDNARGGDDSWRQDLTPNDPTADGADGGDPVTGGWRRDPDTGQWYRNEGVADSMRRASPGDTGSWRDAQRAGPGDTGSWRDAQRAGPGDTGSWRDDGRRTRPGDTGNWRDGPPSEGGRRRIEPEARRRGEPPRAIETRAIESRPAVESRAAIESGRPAEETGPSWQTRPDAQGSPQENGLQRPGGEGRPAWRAGEERPDWRSEPRRDSWQEADGRADWREPGRPRSDGGPDWRENGDAGRANGPPGWRADDDARRADGPPGWRADDDVTQTWRRDDSDAPRRRGRDDDEPPRPTGGARAIGWRGEDAADPWTPGPGDMSTRGGEGGSRTPNAVGRARPMNPNRRRMDGDGPDVTGTRMSRGDDGPGTTNTRMTRGDGWGTTGTRMTRGDGPGTTGTRMTRGDSLESTGTRMSRGDAPVGPDVWRREPGMQTNGNWPGDVRDADWRDELRAESGAPVGDAVTEIRRVEPDWLQAEREASTRTTAVYRESATSTDWRKELTSGPELTDGESRRYNTQDFVPFKGGGATSVSAAPVSPNVEAMPPPAQRGADVDEDTQWPPRRAAGSASPSSTGSYERRPVGGGLATAMRPTSLLEPDEDEIEEDTGGPLAAVGYTAVWYGVPVVLFLLYYLVVLNGDEKATALDTVAAAAPQFGLSLVLSMGVAVGLRWASGSWKAVSVGLAAAVMGGGLATVLSSAITGNSLS